ncbi:MAG: uroporphyrinogen decarboxylase family protein [Candidatus Bathyarchaeia archaeon]
MKPLDRFYKSLDLVAVDRPPVIPQATYCVAGWLGLDLRRPAYDAKLMADSLIEGLRRVGYEGVYVGWEASFNILAEAFGAVLEGAEGELPKVSKPILRDVDDIDRLPLPDPWLDGRMPIHLEAIERVCKAIGGEVPVLSYVPGPLTLSTLLLGSSKTFRYLYFEPDRLSKLMEALCRASISFAKAKIESGCDVIVVADPTSSMVKPDVFERHLSPYINRILEVIGGDATPSLHICGNTSKMLASIGKLKIKIFEVDTPVDLSYAKSILKDVCVMGNVSTTLLKLGRPNDIEREVVECIRKAGLQGYIVSSGCEVPYSTPIENVKAMVDSTLKIGKRCDITSMDM